MLTKIKLTNFRKHRDLTLDFESGLIVIRAANEGGKSTIIEAMLYALYGARALREPLANTVTYGFRDSTARVEAEFSFGMDAYRFCRHKGGAEVYVNGAEEPYVTGQNEVSAFAAQLIGADLNTSAKLMMASQGNLRGALEQGPKATAEMIEGLADFDLFDFLIDEMNKELPLGSSNHLERTLLNLTESLEKLSSEDFKQDIENLSNSLAQHQKEQLEVQEQQDTLRGQIQAKEAELEGINKGNQLAKTLENQKNQAQLQLQQVQKEIESAQISAALAVDDERLQVLKDRQISAGENAAALRAHNAFAALPTNTDVWDSTYELLEKEISTSLEEQTKLREQIQEDQTQVRLKTSRLIHDTECPTCKREIDNVDQVVKTNEAIQVEIEGHNTEIKRRKLQIQCIEGGIKELNEFKKSVEPFYNFIDRYGDYVEVDHSQVPPKIKWAVALPEKMETAAELAVEINKIELAKSQRDQALAKLGTLNQLMQSREEALAQVNEQLQNVVVRDASPQLQEIETLKSNLANTITKLKEVGNLVITTHTSIQNLKNRQEYSLKEKSDIEAQITLIKTQVQDLDFNNNLLKKVRLSRPLVADQLWNMVLAAVSTSFSRVRGEQSIVTKDKDGFKVNGESVAGLSGSTLDILGASIRNALIRTFIPNCPFVVYDEPFAAMDENRVMAMLDFIQTSGFKQTLVVTHEEISEQIADQLIYL